jgi:hypothetical protein
MQVESTLEESNAQDIELGRGKKTSEMLILCAF